MGNLYEVDSATGAIRSASTISGTGAIRSGGQVSGQSANFGSLTVNGNAITGSAAAGSVPNAIVTGSTNLTVTSGISTTALRVDIPKSIIGDSFINVVSGTSTVAISADAIIAGSSNLAVTSGTSTVSIDLSSTPSVTTLTATTVTGTTGNFAGNLNAQNVNASVQVFGTTVSGGSGGVRSASVVQGQSAVFSTSMQATTVTGTTGQFAGTVSAQRGDFSIGLTVSGIPVRIDSGGGGSGITAIVQDTNPTLGGNLNGGSFTATNLTSISATTVTGTTGQFAGTVSAKTGDFSTGLTISGSPVCQVPLLRVVLGTTATVWTNMPTAATFAFGATQGQAQEVDLRPYTQVRLLVSMGSVAGAAASVLRLRGTIGSTLATAATTPIAIAGNDQPKAAINVTNTVINTGFVPLLSTFRVPRAILYVVGSGGDAVLDPTLGAMSAEFK